MKALTMLALVLLITINANPAIGQGKGKQTANIIGTFESAERADKKIALIRYLPSNSGKFGLLLQDDGKQGLDFGTDVDGLRQFNEYLDKAIRVPATSAQEPVGNVDSFTDIGVAVYASNTEDVIVSFVNINTNMATDVHISKLRARDLQKQIFTIIVKQ